MKPRFVLTFEAMPGAIPVPNRLRFLLRRMLRSLGFRCLSIIETAPVKVARADQPTTTSRASGSLR